MRGKVIKEPEIFEDKATYELSYCGKQISAESSGRQAVKDFLFIRRGQDVEIEGDPSKNHIKVSKAKIDISNLIG